MIDVNEWVRPEIVKVKRALTFFVFRPEQYKPSKMDTEYRRSRTMISDGEFVTNTSKGEELDQKKAPGRTGAKRTGKLSRRACYFVGCGPLRILTAPWIW